MGIINPESQKRHHEPDKYDKKLKSDTIYNFKINWFDEKIAVLNDKILFNGQYYKYTWNNDLQKYNYTSGDSIYSLIYNGTELKPGNYNLIIEWFSGIISVVEKDNTQEITFDGKDWKYKFRNFQLDTETNFSESSINYYYDTDPTYYLYFDGTNIKDQDGKIGT